MFSTSSVGKQTQRTRNRFAILGSLEEQEVPASLQSSSQSRTDEVQQGATTLQNAESPSAQKSAYPHTTRGLPERPKQHSSLIPATDSSVPILESHEVFTGLRPIPPAGNNSVAVIPTSYHAKNGPRNHSPTVAEASPRAIAQTPGLIPGIEPFPPPIGICTSEDCPVKALHRKGPWDVNNPRLPKLIQVLEASVTRARHTGYGELRGSALHDKKLLDDFYRVHNEEWNFRNSGGGRVGLTREELARGY